MPKEQVENLQKEVKNPAEHEVQVKGEKLINEEAFKESKEARNKSRKTRRARNDQIRKPRRRATRNSKLETDSPKTQ